MDFDSYENLAQWLGDRPHLSKLGMITKEKDGKTKRRLILDCKQSHVNDKACSGGKLLLPRISDAIDDALYLMHQCQPNDGIEWLVPDFSTMYHYTMKNVVISLQHSRWWKR